VRAPDRTKLRFRLSAAAAANTSRGVVRSLLSDEPLSSGSAASYGNLLLRALAPADLDLLRPGLEPVDLPLDTVLFRPREPIRFVHFLEAGLASDVAMTGKDRPVECGLIGVDGFVGMPVVLGTDRGIHESVMQIGGHGFRIETEALQSAIERSASLRGHLLRYAHAFMSQTAQSAACNARHAIEQRLARWLLMARDRMPDDRVPLTHEYLAVMLGVRRAGVTVALHALEGERLVRGGRGHVTILDRRGLEARTCACYGLVKREFERVLGANN
jgi:CRP-like cAMP-binding protein